MAQTRQLTVLVKDVSAVPRTVPGHSHLTIPPRSRRYLPLGTHLVTLVVLAAVVGAAADASAQTCLRPKWTECVEFPNGGRHTGVSPQGTAVQTEVSSGPKICVGNEEEIGAQTYAQFWRNGVPWPDRDWEVNVETFCFYKN
jgi:hypothetical protein